MKQLRVFLCMVLILLGMQKVGMQAFAVDTAQEYLDAAPFSLQAFAQAPLDSLFSLLFVEVDSEVKLLYGSYLYLLSYILFGTMIHMLVVKNEWSALLDLLIAGGSFLLVSQSLLSLTEKFSSSAEEWRIFLLGFIPAFATVVASCGETVAASIYSGFFLMAISAFAQFLAYFLVPFIECYLAFSVTCAFWIGDELSDACKIVGKLLKKLVSLAGTVFAFIFGIQRVFSAAADNVVIETSKTIGSTVPIIGQTVSGVATTFLAGMQVVKTGLGFAAIAFIAASFLPLYCLALSQLLALSFIGILCKFFSLTRCSKLFECLSIGVEAMMAVVALFFFMMSVGTALMIVIGTGG